MRQQHPPPADPADPIAAATHPDPYPYYARIAAERPFHFDPSLGMWIAAGAAAVAEVLGHAACRVRPAAEPVPAALRGTAAGAIFGHLVRMTDGAGHCPLKSVIAAALGAIDEAAITSAAEGSAEILAARIGAAADPAEWMRFAFALPSHVLGSMLGFGDDVLAGVASDVGDLVRGVAPGASADQVAAGSGAADRLRERAHAVLAAGAQPGLLHAMVDAVRAMGGGVEIAIDNAIGLMVQAHDGTAGLIGNTLLALARDPAGAAGASADGARIRAAVERVLRFDPPVQNTRRFVGAPATIAGQQVEAGDVILVLLAAANRDPASSGDSGIDAGYAFGAGAHACPGGMIAAAIACAGVARLLANGVDPARIDPHPTYRPSINCHIPVLTCLAVPDDGGADRGVPACAVAGEGSR